MDRDVDAVLGPYVPQRMSYLRRGSARDSALDAQKGKRTDSCG